MIGLADIELLVAVKPSEIDRAHEVMANIFSRVEDPNLREFFYQKLSDPDGREFLWSCFLYVTYVILTNKVNNFDDIFREIKEIYDRHYGGDKVCPVCGKKYHLLPTVSRKDYVTQICPICALHETSEDENNAEKRMAEIIQDLDSYYFPESSQ